MGFLSEWFGGKALKRNGREYNAMTEAERDFERDILRNRIWYRGRPEELSRFYGQRGDGENGFWAASAGTNVRKIHSGLPGLMVDLLSDITVNDFLGLRWDDEGQGKVWESIARENGFKALLKEAIRKALALGDGVFKICWDDEVSDYPIIEFLEADRVKMDYKRGRLWGVEFSTGYEGDSGKWGGKGKYQLREVYYRGGVKYRLERDGKEVPLDALPETAELKDIEFNVDRKFVLAVPLVIDRAEGRDGRGKSIFEGRIGAFDGIDEILSQWIDALRDGRVVKYIPSNLLPRNPSTGEVMSPNGFDSRYVATEADLGEDTAAGVRVVQPDIRTEALFQSYVNFFDIAIQGIIAPATLGVDMKKLDNAEAQREKEKATLYTRSKIIGVLQEVLPELAKKAVWVYELMRGGMDLKDFHVTAEFGEYANPSFEAQVETIGKGRQMGVISVETAVEQLYGDTWSPEKKAAEAERLKGEGRIPESNS